MNWSLRVCVCIGLMGLEMVVFMLSWLKQHFLGMIVAS